MTVDAPREPIFRIPPVCLALLVAMACIHLARVIWDFDILPFTVQAPAFWAAPLAPDLAEFLLASGIDLGAQG